MSFTSFYKTSLGFARVAILANLEYRLNFIIDAVIQPFLYCLVEFMFWLGIFRWSGSLTINGHDRSSYFAYALMIPFFTRISTNWMYEFRMTSEVSSGRVNAILARPVTFYHVHLSELLGYKFIVALCSFWLPFAVLSFFDLPLIMNRLPLAVAMLALAVIFTYNLGFILSGLAFYFTRVGSFTVMKNMLMWVLAGEVLPVDALPEFIRPLVLNLPFVCGGYLPVAYLTGRIQEDLMLRGFVSVTLGIVVTGIMGSLLWRRGLRSYTGTGA
jgi:ABC-2 type transport system permease protein